MTGQIQSQLQQQVTNHTLSPLSLHHHLTIIQSLTSLNLNLSSTRPHLHHRTDSTPVLHPVPTSSPPETPSGMLAIAHFVLLHHMLPYTNTPLILHQHSSSPSPTTLFPPPTSLTLQQTVPLALKARTKVRKQKGAVCILFSSSYLPTLKGLAEDVLAVNCPNVFSFFTKCNYPNRKPQNFVCV